MSKYNIGLKLRLQESLSEPEFYGDLVYNFTKIIGKFDFSVQFKNDCHSLQKKKKKEKKKKKKKKKDKLQLVFYGTPRHVC